MGCAGGGVVDVPVQAEQIHLAVGFFIPAEVFQRHIHRPVGIGKLEQAEFIAGERVEIIGLADFFDTLRIVGLLVKVFDEHNGIVPGCVPQSEAPSTSSQSTSLA